MKIVKKLVLLSLLATMACNGTKNQKEQSPNIRAMEQPSEYPAIVDSLGVQKLYDKTKWRMYLLVCDDTPMLRNGKYLFTPPKSFGALDLKLDSLSQRNDGIAFYFDFYINDTLSLYKVLMSIYPRDMKKEYYSGMLFPKNQDSEYIQDSIRICYVSNQGFFSTICMGPIPKSYYDTTKNRYINPLQPDVIKYIQENKDQLDPWFRKEAEKRGIIK